MTSFLIIGKPIEKAKNHALDICLKDKINKIDITVIESEKTVGIEKIRDLQKRIFLKPLKSDQKAVILESYNGLTLEAQNALLKVLEEPPANTIIIILTASLDSILPTVLSRCVIVNINETKKLTGEEIADNLRLLSSVKNNYSRALVLAQNNSKDKEFALLFLEKLIISCEKNLNNNGDFSLQDLGKILKKLQTTYTIIKTANVNTRFALENLFLNL